MYSKVAIKVERKGFGVGWMERNEGREYQLQHEYWRRY
jgi:hypothetical protein